MAGARAAEVEFHTSKGLMVFDIDEERAPLTAENFLTYVRDGFYDGLIFHRVIPGFVIQGGGFDENMQQRETRAPVQNEAANQLRNLRYTLSMARTSDPHSATSQFFINLTDNGSLDYSANNPGYAVFGEVVEGQEVVDSIATVETSTVGPYRDVPVQPVVVEKAVVR